MLQFIIKLKQFLIVFRLLSVFMSEYLIFSFQISFIMIKRFNRSFKFPAIAHPILFFQLFNIRKIQFGDRRSSAVFFIELFPHIDRTLEEFIQVEGFFFLVRTRGNIERLVHLISLFLLLLSL